MTAFWISAGISLALTGLLVPVLRRLGIHDVPNDRSLHSRHVPRGGGIAVLLAVLLSTLGTSHPLPQGAGVVLIVALVLGAVGLVDDIRSLPAVVRLAAQGVVALVAAITIERVPADLAVWAPVFIVVATVGVVAYVNAFNFMDGINGISALNSVVCGLWLAWLGHDYDEKALVVLGLALAGAALGFLPWNLSSRIFLGDVGSYGIGGLLAGALALAWASGVPGALVVPPILIYLADTGWVILKRLRSGQSLTQAHRGHVYQRLVLGGWAPWVAATWSAALATSICLIAAGLYEERPAPAILLVALVVLVYLSTPRLTRSIAADRVAS